MGIVVEIAVIDQSVKKKIEQKVKHRIVFNSSDSRVTSGEILRDSVFACRQHIKRRDTVLYCRERKTHIEPTFGGREHTIQDRPTTKHSCQINKRKIATS